MFFPERTGVVPVLEQNSSLWVLGVLGGFVYVVACHKVSHGQQTLVEQPLLLCALPYAGISLSALGRGNGESRA